MNDCRGEQITLFCSLAFDFPQQKSQFSKSLKNMEYCPVSMNRISFLKISFLDDSFFFISILLIESSFLFGAIWFHLREMERFQSLKLNESKQDSKKKFDLRFLCWNSVSFITVFCLIFFDFWNVFYSFSLFFCWMLTILLKLLFS